MDVSGTEKLAADSYILDLYESGLGTGTNRGHYRGTTG